jgi:hypothetical protein
MAQGAGTLFRMVMAGLLMLTALVLFGVPSTAHAHGIDHHASQSITASPTTPQSADMRATSVFLPGKPDTGTAVVSAAPAAPADHDGCGEHNDKAPAAGCCFGAACPMMHGGVTPVGLLPMPLPDTSTVSMPSSLLSKGIGTLPALKPPRASV